MNAFIFILATFSAVAKFVSGNESRIIGGDDADIHEFPWQASLRSKPIGVHFCGGSLIASRWILTAAHCCYEDLTFTKVKSAANIQVHLGAHYRFDEPINGEKIFDVDRIFPHEDFSRKKKDDIGLVRMTKKVLGSEVIHMIPMAGPNNLLVGGEDVVLTGWGTTLEKYFGKNKVLEFDFCGKHYKFDKNEASKFGAQLTKCGLLFFIEKEALFYGSPDKLQKVTVPVQPESNCRHEFGEVSYCVGTAKQGSCSGDSGGPMVRKINRKWTLFGVTSYGDAQCRLEKGFSRYTKVSHYSKWIAKTMRFRG